MSRTCYFITGTSSGIGKALVEKLLQQEQQNEIYGFSRSAVSFKNNRYHHQIMDLSKPYDLIDFSFPMVADDFDRLVLVNNAGLLSPIQYVGEQNNQELADLLTVNMMAPALLTNIFIKTFSLPSCQKLIINIGSGAANLPYDGWSAYCSSKAGLHQYSQVLKEELIKRNRENTFVFCIMPGIVDTKMQNLIRDQKTTDFSYKDKFVVLHEQSQLVAPNQTAEKLIQIIENPKKYETLLDLRNL